MIKDLKFSDPNKANMKDGFAESSGSVVTTKVEQKDKGFIDAVVKFGKGTANMVVDESKTLAPAVADTFEKSSKRLNNEKRLIGAIPNSYLYWGIVAVIGYMVAKRI